MQRVQRYFLHKFSRFTRKNFHVHRHSRLPDLRAQPNNISRHIAKLIIHALHIRTVFTFNYENKYIMKICFASTWLDLTCIQFCCWTPKFSLSECIQNMQLNIKKIMIVKTLMLRLLKRSWRSLKHQFVTTTLGIDLQPSTIIAWINSFNTRV